MPIPYLPSPRAHAAKEVRDRGITAKLVTQYRFATPTERERFRNQWIEGAMRKFKRQGVIAALQRPRAQTDFIAMIHRKV